MSNFVTIEVIPSTPATATKSCDANGVNSWTTGINQLDWTAPPPIILGVNFRTSENRFMYLQYSAIDNNRPKPAGPSFYHTVLGRTTPEPDSFWTTLRTWGNAELPSVGAWPTTYQHLNVPHSTLYYYRVIFIVLRENDTPRELDSNVATVVQPFDLGFCTVPNIDACTTAQCNTPRLVWDAPILYVPFINWTRCPCTTPPGCQTPDNVNAPWNRITVTWPYTPTPSSYDVYKSTNGTTFTKVVTNAALNACNDWYDSDTTNPVWYYFAANRPNGSIINSNVVKAAY